MRATRAPRATPTGGIAAAPWWCEDSGVARARVPQICGIHHVHVWGLTPQYLMLTMHIMLKQDHRDTTVVVRRVKRLLNEEFGIHHSTIEVEAGECADGGPGNC